MAMFLFIQRAGGTELRHVETPAKDPPYSVWVSGVRYTRRALPECASIEGTTTATIYAHEGLSDMDAFRAANSYRAAVIDGLGRFKRLAELLRDKPYAEALDTWREEVKGPKG